jgi:hypothetical protein
MKKIIFYLILSSMMMVACSSGNDGKAKSEEESYQLTKEELLKKEQRSPQSFLIVSGRDQKNIVGQTVVKGNITNKASVAVFKDVSLKLSFYSQTQALLETDKETIFETFRPGESKNFKTKYFAPKGTDSVALEVLGAKVVME